MPNNPNPDVNAFDVDPDEQNRTDIESDSENKNTDKIPVPPDVQRDQIPVEEPPEIREKPPIEEDLPDTSKRLV